MYIGNLNHLVDFSASNVTVSETGNVPAMKKNGNPLRGQSLYIYWKEKIYSGIDIRLPFEHKVFVDQIRLTFPVGPKLSSVSLYSGEKTQLLQKYMPETGHSISRPQILLEVNYETDILILSLEGDFTSVGLENLEIFGSYGNDGLYPTAKDAKISDVRIPVSQFRGCWGDCPEGRQAAGVLTQKLSVEGIELPLVDGGTVRFLREADVAENGFRLQIQEESVEVYASDLRGFVYGAETVIKLLHDGTLPVCQISDAPRMAFRGVHLYLPGREEIPFFYRLVEHVLSPMGYNCIFMEFSGGMVFESHPEINEAYINAVKQGKSGAWPQFPHSEVAGGEILTKKEVEDLVSFAGSFGIDVIPEVQSLGHVQYLTVAHPEIAEIEDTEVNEDTEVDTSNEDERPKKFYHHCYCPSNPKSYEILFDILDEIIEVVKPKKYVHMGHDEVYEIGVCPVCRKNSPAKLLADDINRIHDHLAQKGLTMMMWADMLQPVTKYETHSAIDFIPKDIIMLDFIWYFHMDKDIEDNLLNKGFNVLFGNMYSSHFPRYESRIQKPGIIGAQTSAWVGTNPEQLGREGKLYEMLFSAQMMWSDSYSSNYKFTYDRMLKERIPSIRAQLLDCTYPSALSDASCSILAEQPDLGVMEFEADCCCDSLVFCHTADKKLHRVPWLPLEEIGQYLVAYDDGTEIPVPITYGGTIGYYGRRQNEPFPHSYYRHNGYTTTFMVDSEEHRRSDGTYYCIYRYEWLNPWPERTIRQITLNQPEDCPAKVVIHRISAMKA